MLLDAPYAPSANVLKRELCGARHTIAWHPPPRPKKSAQMPSAKRQTASRALAGVFGSHILRALCVSYMFFVHTSAWIRFGL